MVFRVLKRYVSRVALCLAAYGNMIVGMNDGGGGGGGQLTAPGLASESTAVLAPLPGGSRGAGAASKEQLSYVAPPVESFESSGQEVSSSLMAIHTSVQSLLDLISMLPEGLHHMDSRIEELTSIAKDIRGLLKEGIGQEKDRFDQLAGYMKGHKGTEIGKPSKGEDTSEEFFDTEEELTKESASPPSQVVPKKLRVLVIRDGEYSHFDLGGFVENSLLDYKKEMKEFLESEITKMDSVILPALLHLHEVKYQKKDRSGGIIEVADTPDKLKLEKIIGGYRNLREEYTGEHERVSNLEPSVLSEKVMGELVKIMEDMYCAGGISFDLFTSLVVGLANAEGKKPSDEVRLSLYGETEHAHPCVLLGDFDRYMKGDRPGPSSRVDETPLVSTGRAQVQFNLRRAIQGGLHGSGIPGGMTHSCGSGSMTHGCGSSAMQVKTLVESAA